MTQVMNLLRLPVGMGLMAGVAAWSVLIWMGRTLKAHKTLVILGGLTGLAALVALYRYWAGLGAISNLSDAWPWGLWIGFDLLCGVALAAGAFTTAAAVYILGQEQFRAVLRPAILTGFLGYLMVIFALLVDLGRPERIWHLIVYWNPHSVMFEVGWCVMLYTTVLALEFSPLVLEKLVWHWPLRLLHAITIPLVILGVILSTLHQSSLGSLFLIMPTRLHPLWYSPLLPVFFFLTAVAVGPAMVILESSISSRVFKRGLETKVLGGLARAIPYVLGLYLLLKVGDLLAAGKVGLLLEGSPVSLLFWLELLGGVLLPMVLFASREVRRDANRMLQAALLVVGGVILNRLDVSIIAQIKPVEGWYFPHWMELALSAGIVSAGLLAFGLVARYLPLFTAHEVKRYGR